MPCYNNVKDTSVYKVTLNFRSMEGKTLKVETEVVGNNDEVLLEKGDELKVSLFEDTGLEYILESAQVGDELVDLSDYAN